MTHATNGQPRRKPNNLKGKIKIAKVAATNHRLNNGGIRKPKYSREEMLVSDCTSYKWKGVTVKDIVQVLKANVPGSLSVSVNTRTKRLDLVVGAEAGDLLYTYYEPIMTIEMLEFLCKDETVMHVRNVLEAKALSIADFHKRVAYAERAESAFREYYSSQKRKNEVKLQLIKLEQKRLEQELAKTQAKIAFLHMEIDNEIKKELDQRMNEVARDGLERLFEQD